jgi:hypothetical protein
VAHAIKPGGAASEPCGAVAGKSEQNPVHTTESADGISVAETQAPYGFGQSARSSAKQERAAAREEMAHDQRARTSILTNEWNESGIGLLWCPVWQCLRLITIACISPLVW